MKYGLVLEGGAMRGLFTAGVLDAFLEEGLRFHGTVGVSAGAAFGCNFKSAQKGRALRYNTRYCRDARYCSLASLLFTGDLYGARFCYHTLPMTLDPFDWERFEADPAPFWALCTEVETGLPQPFLCRGSRERVLEIFRASASMPLVSREVSLDGKKYLDGGISSSIPLAFLEGEGFEKNVVVLTQPRNYEKKPTRAAALVALRYGKDAPLTRCMKERHERYNEEKALVLAREQEGRAFVLAPEAPLPAGRTEKNAEKLRLCHRLGYEAAKAQMEKIRTFLSEDNKKALQNQE